MKLISHINVISHIKQLATLVTLALFAGCDKTYDEPAEIPLVTMQPTMTIAALKALYTGDATMVNAPGAIVAGKVISTDKYGNFYRSFYIQDETSGIEIKIGKTTLYNTYTIGQEVYLKPHTLCLGDYGKMVSIGSPSTDPEYRNGYMDSPLVINSSIFRGELKTPVAPVEISSIDDITEDHMGTWVIIKNAVYQSGMTQYSKAHPNTYPITTWAVKNNPDTPEDDAIYGLQTFTITDGEIVVRTSGYAKFADTTVPFAAGTKVNLKGVMTRYTTTAGVTTHQLALNTDRDVEEVAP
jgi:hypothetical protein